MWRLLRAEIVYHRLSLTLLLAGFLGICAAVMTGGWQGFDRDGAGLGMILLTLTAMAWFIRLLRLIAEKTDRYVFPLPLTAREIGWTRTLFPVVFWVAGACIFWLCFLVIRPDDFQMSAVWAMLSMGGFVLAANAYSLIHRDLTFCITAKWQRALLSCVYALITVTGILLFVLLFGVLRSMSTESFSYRLFGHVLRPWVPATVVDSVLPTAAAALALLTTGIVLTHLSAVVFQRRRAYLE